MFRYEPTVPSTRTAFVWLARYLPAGWFPANGVLTNDSSVAAPRSRQLKSNCCFRISHPVPSALSLHFTSLLLGTVGRTVGTQCEFQRARFRRLPGVNTFSLCRFRPPLERLSISPLYRVCEHAEFYLADTEFACLVVTILHFAARRP